MKKYILIILLFVLLTNCKNFFYGAMHNMKYVKDVNYYLEGIPSYQVNIEDRYCVFYTDRVNNIYFTDNIDNKIQEENNYNLIISFLKSKNIKIKEESLFEFNGKTGKDDSLKIVKQREIDNNFKNCDYLIEFMLDKGIEHPKAIFLRIKIDNIKTDKNIGFYSMSEDDTIFNKKTQEQKIEKMLTKWWETQLKSQPKARPLETWCVGNCNDNKNNKNE